MISGLYTIYRLITGTAGLKHNVLRPITNGSLYLSVTPKFYTKVLHQTSNPTAEVWCKTVSRTMFGVKPKVLNKLYLHLLCSQPPVSVLDG